MTQQHHQKKKWNGAKSFLRMRASETRHNFRKWLYNLLLELGESKQVLIVLSVAKQD